MDGENTCLCTGLAGPTRQEQVRVHVPMCEEDEVPLESEAVGLVPSPSFPATGNAADRPRPVDTSQNALGSCGPQAGIPMGPGAPGPSSEFLCERLQYLDDVAARVTSLELRMQAVSAALGETSAATSDRHLSTSNFALEPLGAGRLVQSPLPATLPGKAGARERATPESPSGVGSRVASAILGKAATGPIWQESSSSSGKRSASLKVERSEKITHLAQAWELNSKHCIGATVWEMGAYFGLPFLGLGSQVAMLLGFLLNVMIQSALCAVIWSTFLGNDLNMTTEQAAKFREKLGHDYDSMDRHGWVSLTARVCAADESLEIATSQVRAVERIEEYTRRTAWLFMLPAGPVLCTVVLVIWVLSIISDIRDTFSLQLAMHALPRCTWTALEISGDRFRFTAISYRRYYFVTLLTVVRLAVGVVLMLVGGVYLGETTEIEDLVLNAAALGFILEVDNLLFRTIAPGEVETFVHMLEPLRKPRGPYWRGLGCFTVSSFVAATVAVVMLVLEVTMSTLSLLVDVEQTLCRGPQDFVLRQAPSGELVLGETLPFGHGSERSMDGDIIREVLQTQDLRQTSYGQYWHVQLWAFTSVSDRLTVEYVSNRLSALPCTDSLQFVGTSSMPWKQLSYFGTGDEMGCSDFAQYCFEPQQTLLRSLCSKTCQCDSPQSGSLYVGPSNGCLPRCHDDLRARQAELPCVDVPASDFSNASSGVMKLLANQVRDPQFFAWISEEDVARYSAVLGTAPEEVFNNVLAIGSTMGGCNLLVILNNFCLFGGAAFCPLACYCFAPQPDNGLVFYWDSCPPSCEAMVNGTLPAPTGALSTGMAAGAGAP